MNEEYDPAAQAVSTVLPATQDVPTLHNWAGWKEGLNGISGMGSRVSKEGSAHSASFFPERHAFKAKKAQRILLLSFLEDMPLRRMRLSAFCFFLS